jgi:predicted nucleic acid-binding Zn ribbon protein
LALKKYNDLPISEVLKQLVEKNNWKEKLFQNKVKEIWVLKMGTTINSYTKEIRLRRQKLFITIGPAPLRQELTYSKTKIIDLLNEELGEEYIKDVIIR